MIYIPLQDSKYKQLNKLGVCYDYYHECSVCHKNRCKTSTLVTPVLCKLRYGSSVSIIHV